MVEDSIRTLTLMNETGYSIEQDNGQRIYGPPPDWTGPAPKDSEIFIGKLPNDIYEYDIVPLFSSVGKIYKLRIMQNFSGLNRGFAFVQYTTPEEADKAIHYLNNVEIRPGEKIGVVKSRNNCRLYIGKLDTTMTKEEIRDELEKFTDDIVEVVIHESDIAGQNNRGYAFVEYQTHKAAAKARRKLVPCKIKIRGVEVTVDWATPLHECGEILNVFNSLLIKNIRDNAKNEELCQFYSLSNKLKIVKFKRIPNKLVITFGSKEEAEKAMQIYEDIKNTKEFNYFAEKNKRVEMVYLKNNMNLQAFNASVDYTPPKFYDELRTDCSFPNHQHNSNNNPSMADKNIQMNFGMPLNQRPLKLSMPPNNHNFNGTKDMNNNRMNNVSMDTMKNMNGSMNVMRNQQRFNQSSNSNYNNNQQHNGKLSVMTNEGRVTMSTRPIPLGSPYGNMHYQNTLANRLNQSSAGNSLSNTPCTPRSPISNNPFSANSFDLANAWTNSNPLNSLNGNFNNMSAFNQLNASNNLNISKNLMDKNAFNPMNMSYNFGIWTNYGSNLDVSANWSKFKDHKQKYGGFSETNISEEDSNSMKSGDYDEPNFNCFNPINSLNLHENFRGLSVDKSLSKYPLFNPILQQ